MVPEIKNIASLGVDLTVDVEKRNFVSLTYVNVIKQKLDSWRKMSALGQNDDNHAILEMIKNYIEQVEKQMREVRSDALNVLEVHLIPHSVNMENRMFYHILKGDILGFLAEFGTDNEREYAISMAVTAYAAAGDLGMDNLPPTNAMRLSVALNFSKFCYTILGSRRRTFLLVKAAVDDARPEVGALDEISMQLMIRLNNSILKHSPVSDADSETDSDDDDIDNDKLK